MKLKSDRVARVEVDTATSGDNEIIAAPSVGHIEIDYFELIPSGGAQTLTILDGSTQIQASALDDNQGWVYDSPQPLVLTEATAFNLNLSAATQVSGRVDYRILGESM